MFDEQGVFHELGYLNLNKATELFSHKVLKYLSREELISDDVIENILSWEHSGFSVWQGEQVLPDDESHRLFLASYIDRAPVDNSKLLIDENHEKSDLSPLAFSPLNFILLTSTPRCCFKISYLTPI